MKKSILSKMRANLDKALEPPRPKDDNSESIAQRYAPVRSTLLTPPPASSQDTGIHHTSVPNTSVQLTSVSKEPLPVTGRTRAQDTSVIGTPVIPAVRPFPYTSFPNDLIDQLLPELDVYTQAVLLRIYRLSRGVEESETCRVGYVKLAQKCNMSRKQVIICVGKLEALGLLERVGYTDTGVAKADRGSVYRINLPAVTRAHRTSVRRTSVSDTSNQRTPNKENTFKEHTQTQAGVRAGSKFSVEECRRYAEHLRSTGQGINNPGGYATTIHRTGEADALIEAFLHPQPDAPEMNASNCPDCQGTGFYYPGGKEKGIAKCKHSRMVSEDINATGLTGHSDTPG